MFEVLLSFLGFSAISSVLEVFGVLDEDFLPLALESRAGLGDSVEVFTVEKGWVELFSIRVDLLNWKSLRVKYSGINSNINKAYWIDLL